MSETPDDDLARLRFENDVFRAALDEMQGSAREQEIGRLTAVLRNAHGALTDTGVSVPGGLDELLGPSIEALAAERDEARRQRDALVDGIREMLAPYEWLIGTHYEGCEETHWRCGLRKLLREVER